MRLIAKPKRVRLVVPLEVKGHLSGEKRSILNGTVQSMNFYNWLGDYIPQDPAAKLTIATMGGMVITAQPNQDWSVLTATAVVEITN